ncbi:MAG: hypothetical protein OEX07_06285 [Gammaproteobacteria bacterium]|nr:hypothetical protein [Gammaproteobacteria bacterium]
MKICTNCGHEGKPIRQESGAFGLLLFTLAVTTAWSLASQLFWITLPISFVSTILFIYWYFTTTCPKCKNVSMVSNFSLAAKKYRKRPHTPDSNIVYSAREPG